MRRLSRAQARRLALAAQGFTDRRPSGRVDRRHFRRVLERMTILQLDSVNVLCRSHFLPVYARLGPYDRDHLDCWLWRSGENLEYLAHEASITAVEHQVLLRPRMRGPRYKSLVAFQRDNPAYLQAVLDEVAERGPSSVKDLRDPGGRTGPWWGLSKGKRCLEVLHMSGRLSIAERTKTFLTLYDLPERVVPEAVRGLPDLDDHELERQMLLLGAKSHGVGTLADLADYFRLRMPVARPRLAELVKAGALEQVEVEGWTEPAYVHPEARLPRAIARQTFLSPFDPVVWFRPRAERLFDFRYRIEIYVPEAKRVHGYYVLPFLLGDELVGRVDLKADRHAGRLLAKAAHAEPGVDRHRVASAMATELQAMATWLGLDDVRVARRGNLAGQLAKAL